MQKYKLFRNLLLPLYYFFPAHSKGLVRSISIKKKKTFSTLQNERTQFNVQCLYYIIIIIFAIIIINIIT